jgi:hypothetical protein
MLGSVSAAFEQCRLVISCHAGLCHLVCRGGRLGARLPAGADPSQSRTRRANGLFRLLLLSHRPALPQTRAETDAPLGNVLKRIPLSNHSPCKVCPLLCHPEQLSELSSGQLLVKRTVVGGKGVPLTLAQALSFGKPPFTSATPFPPATALPLQRPSPVCHPERSRGICSSADLTWKRGISTCHRFASRPERSGVEGIRRFSSPLHKYLSGNQADSTPEYTAMPATASTPIASSASISPCSRMPPATISCRFVNCFNRCATSIGKPCIVPSRSICV